MENYLVHILEIYNQLFYQIVFIVLPFLYGVLAAMVG